jgi:hypothetical protein
MVLGKREAGGAWTLYEMDGSGGRPTITISADDNHHTISVGIDPNGFIHVSYDVHRDPLKYRKSDAAINSWTGGMTAELSMVGTNESDVTYPTFFNDPSGVLYFMFRDGASGNGDLYFYEYDESGTSWAAATGTSTGGLLIEGTTGGTTYNPYWSQPPIFDANFGAGGYLHLTWVWNGGGSNDRHNIAYVRWNGTAWTQADGTPQTVPITDANDEVAHAVAVGNGLGPFPSIYSDSNSHPHISFKKEDGGGFEQIYHLYHNGSSWSTPVALTSNDQGFGSIGITEEPKSVIAIDRNTDRAYIVTLTYGEGTGLFYYHSTDYSSWSRETITTTQLGHWQPQLSYIYWNENTEFQFPLAPYLTTNTTGLPIRILTVLVPAVEEGRIMPYFKKLIQQVLTPRSRL